PEVLRQEPVTAAADVFAWGAVVAFASTARRPFGDGPDVAVAHRILAGPPPDLAGLPPHLRVLVSEALARDPRVRPAAAVLASRLAGRPATPPHPTRVLPVRGTGSGAGGTRASRPPRRVGGVVLVSAGAVVALAALLNTPGRHAGNGQPKTPTTPRTSATARTPATTAGRAGSGHAGATSRPAPSPAPARQSGVLVASAVPPVQDGDVIFRITNVRCGLRSVGGGERAQDEPAGVRACTALVTVRNTGRVPHLLVSQTLHGSDGRGYASNGFLTPRLG